MAVSEFILNGISVKPGTRLTVDLPAAQLYTHTPLNIPVYVVHGHEPGPVLLICAAIHGDEINGVEIIRRILNLPALKHIKGTLLAVPIVNALGFIHQTRYLPDRRDLNRSFPGSSKGSLAARMARLFKREVLDKSTHVIDLHTGAIHRCNFPQIRANLRHAMIKEMAHAFGAPVILNADTVKGSLRAEAEKSGIPVINYEGGEALRFDESSIRMGVTGIINVMRYLAMLPSVRTRRVPIKPAIAKTSEWIRAGQDGILRPVAALGDHVKKGDIMGYISDPFGEQEISVISPYTGIVIGRSNLPLVHGGEALFHVGLFRAVHRAHKQIEAWNELLDAEPFDGTEPAIV